MTTATIFDLDQQHCETQAAIAESLYIDGATDGFEGVRPTSLDCEYLLGYSSGCRRKLADIQHIAKRLEEEGQVVEALAGEF